LRLPVPAVALVAGGALVVAGCGSSGDDDTTTHSAASRSIPVVATTTQLGDIVRAIGGDAVDVHQILKPNTDPHDYEPRPSDVMATTGAKVVFESGSNLDHWMETILDQAGGDPDVLTIAPDHTPDTVAGEKTGPEASEFDPHWWHDPRNVEAAIPAIRDALTAADPQAKATIDANAAAYLRQVQRLDAGIERCFAQIPADQRKLVTSHDAFNLFAKRYDIDVVGAVIPSQTTQAQPSAADVARLVQLVRDQHVRAIFPESSLSPKLAQSLARQTGATADATLYGDTLGPEGSDGDTYLKMEAANANAMVEGFTGGRQRCQIVP
jgi:ABC-type Zn uptake system ZnuABC Zn-binding protein ZnuA